MTTIRVERIYPHPRATVWRAITDPDLLARWLMPNDFAPIVGHRFTFTTEPGPGFDGIVHCEVKEIVEPSRLAFAWVGGPIDTLVVFTLNEVEGGTRLVMEQSGFKGLKAWLVSRMLKAGSRTIYGKRLPQLLDEIAGGVTPPVRNACMTRGQGLIKRILEVLTR